MTESGRPVQIKVPVIDANTRQANSLRSYNKRRRISLNLHSVYVHSKPSVPTMRQAYCVQCQCQYAGVQACTVSAILVRLSKRSAAIILHSKPPSLLMPFSFLFPV